ncbi:unnamed protein product [Coregonus sp. 'balchen']|nr:unnamed protein product [Coregonus sp. 'balchen']
MAMIYAGHSAAQSSFALSDLLATLKQIQSQYDEIAAKNLDEMDSWYKSKFEDITNKTTKHIYKARSHRSTKQQRYKKELKDLQARIEAPKLELKTTKEKIAHHLCEYQDLLNINMSLEIEITTYMILIEGEDSRLSDMVKGLSLSSSKSAMSSGMSVGMAGGVAGGMALSGIVRGNGNGGGNGNRNGKGNENGGGNGNGAGG